MVVEEEGGEIVKGREGRKKRREGLGANDKHTEHIHTNIQTHNQEWFTWGGEQTETIAIYKPQKHQSGYLQHHKLPIQ